MKLSKIKEREGKGGRWRRRNCIPAANDWLKMDLSKLFSLCEKKVEFVAF